MTKRGTRKPKKGKDAKLAKTARLNVGAKSDAADAQSPAIISEQAGAEAASSRTDGAKADVKASERTSLDAGASPALRFPVVGIGASAGGLEAFRQLLDQLPEKTGMAFVLVQHLDPTHGSALKEILSRSTKIPVTEVMDGVAIEPDHIYVIPANTNMSIQDGMLRLGARVLVQGQHMPINNFLNSLATERGDQAISVILSGTASDGTEGCSAVKAAGGITFAQDEKSAKYPSMPRSAVHSGCIDFVMTPGEIARELTRIGRHPYVAREAAKEIQAVEGAPGGELDRILAMVRDATGVDFAHYKQSTMQRRIKRRMVVLRIESLPEYLRYIKRNPQEIEHLYRDILIHVTGFFRDPKAFEALRTTVLPALFSNRRVEDSPIRIWVPGCSTGEEVYSIAMTLLEYLWDKADTRLHPYHTKRLQIFATDISDVALERARAGLYTESAVAGVSPERLKRFFLPSDGGYQISKSVREMCVFARQNVIKDPPFSNLDLVSCRNLLIYLGPELRQKVVPLLHYALRPAGFLMLGESESLGSFPDHFTLLDKKNKIYQKKQSGAPLITYFSRTDIEPRKLGEVQGPKPQSAAGSSEREVERVLLNRFVPVSIVVNSEMEIVQFRGKTGAYLEPPSGQPTFSLSKMAREGLLVDLRAALNQAKKKDEPVRRTGVRVQSNGGTREVDLEVLPIRDQNASGRFYVVVFQEAPGHYRAARSREARSKRGERAAAVREKDRTEREVSQLREQLQALIEDHETTLEEYKSANEEVLSANEELQSTNEELETAKEELQSTNEELTTLNEELQNRNTELSVVNNDLLNLFGNVSIPVVILGNDLRIRRFTPPAQKLLNLLPADIGRRIGEVRPNVEIDNLEEMAREAIESATVQERETREVEGGGWHALRVRPYRTWDNKIDGAVITFQDINDLKAAVEETHLYSDALVENARDPTLVLDHHLRVTTANHAFYRTFKVSPPETEGRLIYELGNGQWNIPKLSALLDQLMATQRRIDDFEVRHDFPDIGPRTMLLNARRVEPRLGSQMVLLSIEDVTEKAERLGALSRQATLLDLARDAVITLELNGKIQYWNHGAEELYEWKKEEAVGKSVWDLLQPQFPKPLDDIKEELRKTGHWEGELVHTRRDGARRVVSSRWALQDGTTEKPLILEINTDITDRKRFEDSLRRLSARLMRVQDEERRRIARELHDSTGQKLTALKISLGIVQGKLDPNSKEYAALTECTDLADESMQEIRSMSQLLHPPLIDEAGLGSAIRWLVQGFSERSGVKVALSIPEELKRMPEEIEITLFRVLQEALTNVTRHSGAKSVEIQITQKPEAAILKVSDNGTGLPAELLESSQPGDRPFGVGVLGMKERLAQFGGKLDIRNGRKGAVVTAEVPIPPQEAAKIAGAS
jgi:two-component system, chemotaxis family, CheB/CheR fusion protein